MAALVTVATATVTVAAPAAATTGVILNAGSLDAIPDRYIAVLRDDSESGDLDTAVADLASRYGATVDATYRTALRGFSAEMSSDQASQLAADPRIAYVEQDLLVRSTTTQDDPPSWGLDRVDQRSLPLNEAYTYDTTASNVTAYVIDSGIRISHHQFEGRARYGRDFVDDDNVADDCNSHGTHVAGTIGGVTTGVAKRPDLVAVRVMDCEGQGSVSRVLEGVDWVTANASRPAVVNMSVISDALASFDDGVRGSIAAGITYVIAAGNDNANACDFSPGRIEEAITVGASTRDDVRRSSSNSGGCLDVYAPGEDIISASIFRDDVLAIKSGTSMAAPHVTGAAALHLAKSPSASPTEVQRVIVLNSTPDAIAHGVPGSISRSPLLLRPMGPVVTSLSCTTGHSSITCVAAHAHGTNATLRWTVNGVRRPEFDNSTATVPNCVRGASFRFEIEVQATNGTAEARNTTLCHGNG